MDFEVTLVKSATLSYDISENVTAVDITDNINISSICTFGTLKDADADANPEQGDGIRIACKGFTYFCGYVFRARKSKSKEIKVTAYDQLRYLKASDTFVFKKNETASQIVHALCDYMKLKKGVIEDTKCPLAVLTFDDKPMLDISAEAITKTLVATKQLYFLKDNNGAVDFRNIRNCVTDLVIAPDSLLLNYDYERDIDTDTYNQIKLVRDNKDTGQREIYMSRDSNAIKRWGTLQYYEKVDDNLNSAQIKEKSDSLLFLKNRVGQKLSAEVIGEKEVRAGNMVYIDISDADIAKFLLCTSAKHRFTNAAHTVKAEFKLV